MKRGVVLSFLVVATLCSALPSRGFAAKSGSPISVEVIYGEKRTRFQVSRSKSGAEILREGSSEPRKISAADFRALEAQAKLSTIKPNDARLCPRSAIKVTSRHGVGVGCIGSPTPAAREATLLANFLNIAN